MKVFCIVFLLCTTALGGYAFPIQQESTPTLISLSPSSAVQGATIEVRLTGSNFAVGSTSVTPSSGLVVNSVHVDTSATLRALLQVIGPPGTVNVSVTTLAGTSSAMAFAIQPSPLDSAAPLEVTHFAGSIGGFGFSDGTGSQARFTNACGCGSWTDGTSLFLTDSNAIRQVTIATGVVTTIAGNAETAGFVDGVGTAARFSNPSGIWGHNNVLYVADGGNSAIRKIDLSSGQVTTVVLLDGAPFYLSGDGNLLYFSDVNNVFIQNHVNVGFYRIRAVSPSTGIVQTIAQYSISNSSLDFAPVNLWTDGLNLYGADRNISAVRRIYLPTGASNIVASFNHNNIGDDGPPDWIWSDGVHLYVACSIGIRILDPNAVNLNSLAGPLLVQRVGGPLTGYGNFIYAYLTQIDVATGNTTALAGSVNQSGTLDGIGSAALFSNPTAMWGDGKVLYVSDSDNLNNNTIRKVDLATAQVTTLSIVPTLDLGSKLIEIPCNLFKLK